MPEQHTSSDDPFPDAGSAAPLPQMPARELPLEGLSPLVGQIFDLVISLVNTTLELYAPATCAEWFAAIERRAERNWLAELAELTTSIEARQDIVALTTAVTKLRNLTPGRYPLCEFTDDEWAEATAVMSDTTPRMFVKLQTTRAEVRVAYRRVKVLFGNPTAVVPSDRAFTTSGDEWLGPLGVAQWGRVFGISRNSASARLKQYDTKHQARCNSRQSWQVRRDALTDDEAEGVRRLKRAL
jgi:hypothetical protein